jgi:hypothetical protein
MQYHQFLKNGSRVPQAVKRARRKARAMPRPVLLLEKVDLAKEVSHREMAARVIPARG